MSRASSHAISSASKSTASFKNWQLGVLKVNRQKDPAFEPAVDFIRATYCWVAFSGNNHYPVAFSRPPVALFVLVRLLMSFRSQPKIIDVEKSPVASSLDVQR